MVRKLQALFLVFCWIVLSGVDLLEDLRFDNGTNAYTQRTTANDLAPYLKPRVNLANNIVESAASLEVFSSSILLDSAVAAAVHRLFSFRKVSALHKLKRVFLI